MPQSRARLYNQTGQVVPTYVPVGVLPVGGDTLTTQAAGATARAAAGVAGSLGQRVDAMVQADLRRQAQVERTRAYREGSAAGAEDMGARMEGDSIRVEAFNAGAIEAASRNLEGRVLTRLDELGREHANNPIEFASQAQQFRQGLEQTLPPDMRAGFAQNFDRMARPLFNRARRNMDQAVAQGRVNSLNDVMPGRVATVRQLAQLAADDPEAEASLQAELARIRNDLLQNGPTGEFEHGGQRFTADPRRTGIFTPQGIAAQMAALDRLSEEATAIQAFRRAGRSVEWIEDWTRRADQAGIPPARARQLAGRMREDATRGYRQVADAEDREQRDARGRIGQEVNQTASDGFGRLGRGELTGEWLDQNRPRLSVPDRQVLRHAADGRAVAQDNPQVVADLARRMDDEPPGAFQARAAREVLAGRLTPATYRTLVSGAPPEEGDDGNPATRGRREITRGLTLPRVSGPIWQAARGVQGQAVAAFERWRAENPNAAPGEVDQMARQTMEEARRQLVGGLIGALPPPRGFSGNREIMGDPDLLEAERRVMRGLRAGDIPRAIATRELRLIRDWRAVLAFRPRGDRARGSGE